MDGRGRLRRHPHFLGSSRNYRPFGALRGAPGRFGGRSRVDRGQGLRAAWNFFNWRRHRAMERSRWPSWRASLVKESGPSQSTLKARARRSPSSSGVGGGGRLAVLFGRLFLDVVHSLADLVLYSDILEAVTVDTCL